MIRKTTLAPAKINLSLRVLGKRDDGFHNLASIVAFADIADELSLMPGPMLSLAVDGPMAALAGANESNLALRAARALNERIPGLQMGGFALTKNLPAGAGLGGGSSDAAAALRLLAEANNIPANDARIAEVAAATGSDIPVCLDPRARLMQGRGDIVSAPVALPPLPAVLVFPGAGLDTAKVFRAFDPASGVRRSHPYEPADIPRSFDTLVAFLQTEANDLEPAARNLVPEIDTSIGMLRQTNAVLVRMSGSGTAVFGIYRTNEDAAAAASSLRSQKPDWWVTATILR